MNYFSHSLSQNPGYSLHERHHPLVSVIVSRDNPHHSQRVHHGRQDIDDGLERGSMSDVLKVSLEGRQEAHVVLGLCVILVEV